MRIIDYTYHTGTVLKEGIVQIPELNRTKPAVNQFINLYNPDVTLTCPTAFIFIDGTVTSQSETGLITNNSTFAPALKRTSVYAAHEWISTFQNPEWLVSMEVVTGTCAAALEAVYKAHHIIMDTFNDAEEVVIIGHERITQDTVRLFRELGIDVICGDGFVYMHLAIGGIDLSVPIWKWAYNKNPFAFDRDTLNSLIPDYRVGYVKLHGTGTESNTEAEQDLEDLATPIRYKQDIGHTQGISALLETCLVLDDPKIRGRILVTANGLGGYYGAFTLTKNYARS